MKAAQISLRVAQDSSATHEHDYSTKRLQMPEIVRNCTQEAKGSSDYGFKWLALGDNLQHHRSRLVPALPSVPMALQLEPRVILDLSHAE